jgi:hypothetical protein
MIARAQDFAPTGIGLQHGGRELALSAAERAVPADSLFAAWSGIIQP